jgi:hypothetical protein
MLALCKFVRMIKKMTEVTYKPTLELGTSLLILREGSLCVTWCFFGNQWLGLFFWGFFYKFVGKEGEGHSGLWSQISENE